MTATKFVPNGGSLHGLRVIDVSGSLAAYATRLLGDLGADVIRIEPIGGSSVRRQEPLVLAADGSEISLQDLFVNAGKRSLSLDLDQPEGRQALHRLLADADILVETFSRGRSDSLGLAPKATAALNPRLVHVTVTAFGRDRTSDDVEDDDLTIMAAGGLLHLGGYPDTGPILAYGDQAHVAASLFAAVGALVAIVARKDSGRGAWIDVSAQECVAQALEDTVPTFELTGQVRQRLGSEPREAGSGMYRCADGKISMVAGRVGTARAWRTLVEWLVAEGVDGATELKDGRWSELSYRQTDEAIARFGEIFGSFTAMRTRAQLYAEGQRRGIALSPVNDVQAVLADPQLAARHFWVTVAEPALGRDVVFPGPPYRLSATPARGAQPAPTLGADTQSILAGQLGMTATESDAMREASVA